MDGLLAVRHIFSSFKSTLKPKATKRSATTSGLVIKQSFAGTKPIGLRPTRPPPVDGTAPNYATEPLAHILEL